MMGRPQGHVEAGEDHPDPMIYHHSVAENQRVKST